LVALAALAIPGFAAIGVSQAPANERVEKAGRASLQLLDDGFGY
jgi:hypothetical protein